MENEENKETNVKSTIDAVTGLVKAIPVYDDAVKPAAKEIGKSLETVTKTVNIALAPIKALVWGYEKIEDYLSQKVTEKLKDIPKENIITPPPHIAGPTVEAMRFSAHSEDLRELYANLLANSMNLKTSEKTHPGYVEVMKNISPKEARLLQVFISKNHYPKIDIRGNVANNKGGITHFSNFTLLSELVNDVHPNIIPAFLDNFNRLGLIEILHETHLTSPNIYEPLENSPIISNIKQNIKDLNRTIDFQRGMIKVTAFGKNFIDTVVKTK